MVQTAASVEWTVVGSDFEALQLEYTWIKEFDPPFNVQYKDDKTLPVPRDHPRRACSTGARHAQQEHSERALLRAVFSRVGDPRDR